MPPADWRIFYKQLDRCVTSRARWVTSFLFCKERMTYKFCFRIVIKDSNIRRFECTQSIMLRPIVDKCRLRQSWDRKHFRIAKKKNLCMNSIVDAGLNANLNDKQTLYASNTVLIPGICTLRVIVVDYWWYGYFLPAAGIELATPDVYTCRHSDIRDGVLCSGLHNLRYCIFLSHLYLLIHRSHSLRYFLRVYCYVLLHLVHMPI